MDALSDTLEPRLIPKQSHRVSGLLVSSIDGSRPSEYPPSSEDPVRAERMGAGAEVGGSRVAGWHDVPALLDDVVERTRLFARLGECEDSTIITVTAPVGWGKTQLLASWVRSSFCRSDVGWLTIDHRDANPARCLQRIIATVARVPPSQVDAQSREGLVVQLLERLAHRDRPFLLILDDVQWLGGSPVEQELSWALTRLPTGVRIVLSGTYLPKIGLSRLRIQRKVHVLETKDLSFDVDETAMMLARSGVHLSVDSVKRLQARTEGWAAGLRLAALALRDAGSVAAVPEEFTGEDRAVADYLTTEVLGQVPEDLHELLLRTSICESFTADLANVLTGRTDSDQQLRWLAERNLFVVEDAPRKGWFRYHKMFGELLRSKLPQRSETSAASLHRMACTWFAERDLPVMAFQHACLAESWHDAEQLLLANWLGLYLDGQFDTLHTLIDQLPAYIYDANPELALIGIATTLALGGDEFVDTTDAALAVAALGQTITGHRGFTQLVAASEECSEPHPLLSAPPVNPSATVAGLVVNLERARLSVDLPAAAAAAYGLAVLSTQQSALGSAAVTGLQALALQQLGTTEYWAGRRADADAHLREALSTARAKGYAYVEFACLSQLVGVLTAQHRLMDALEVAAEASELARKRGWELSHAAAELWHARGWTAFMHGDLDAAEQYLGWATAAVRRHDVGVRATVLLVRGLVAGARGRTRDALADLDAAAKTVDRVSGRYLFEDYLIAERARSMLALGWNTRAREVLHGHLGKPCTPIILTVVYAEYLASEGATDEAIALLKEGVAQGLGTYDAIIQAMILLGVLGEQVASDSREAFKMFSDALNLAAPEGYVQPFLQFGSRIERLLRMARVLGTCHTDFVDRIRASLAARTPSMENVALEAAQNALTVPLTRRELEVLRAIAEPGVLPDLADKLFVSLNTLKFHLRSVYRKLDVNGRHEAVIKARTLGFI